MSAEKREKEIQWVYGVILGVPLKDTIKEARDGMIKKTLKRGSLWSVQTPQVFPYKSILTAYDQAMKEGFYSTDDSALVERFGGKVRIIMGSYSNIKVTTPEDLKIAEFFLEDHDPILVYKGHENIIHSPLEKDAGV
jgi:2-C-methyl-D-erythritol 4-phosphate cytidylyltransferase